MIKEELRGYDPTDWYGESASSIASSLSVEEIEELISDLEEKIEDHEDPLDPYGGFGIDSDRAIENLVEFENDLKQAREALRIKMGETR